MALQLIGYSGYAAVVLGRTTTVFIVQIEFKILAQSARGRATSLASHQLATVVGR
jgi:hypothetical protein